MHKEASTGPFAAYRYDITADIKWGNARMAHLFRVDPEAIRKGVPASTFEARIVHPDDQDRVLTRLYKALATASDLSESFRMIDASNEERLVFSYGCAIKDDTTGHLLFVGKVIEASPQDVASWDNGGDALEVLAAGIIGARQFAESNDMKMSTHLLDMALKEIGQRMARAVKQRKTDWN